MQSIRRLCVLGVFVAAVVAIAPSIAKSCPRRAVPSGYASWRDSPGTTVPSSTHSVIETRSYFSGPDNPNGGRACRTLPVAATRTVLPAPQPHVAPLSEQTPNDNFMYSGQ
jgi:hypothetical protein